METVRSANIRGCCRSDEPRGHGGILIEQPNFPNNEAGWQRTILWLESFVAQEFPWCGMYGMQYRVTRRVADLFLHNLIDKMREEGFHIEVDWLQTCESEADISEIGVPLSRTLNDNRNRDPLSILMGGYLFEIQARITDTTSVETTMSFVRSWSEVEAVSQELAYNMLSFDRDGLAAWYTLTTAIILMNWVCERGTILKSLSLQNWKKSVGEMELLRHDLVSTLVPQKHSQANGCNSRFWVSMNSSISRAGQTALWFWYD